MDYQRYQLEKAILEKYLPNNTFMFKDLDTPHPYLLIGARTKVGNVYTLRINLENHPNSVPKVFVTKMLYTKQGKPMSEARHDTHTLTSENGWTRICHYGPEEWSLKVSLYKVYLKCVFWLNIYEVHLITGQTMEYYLCRQK